MNNGEIYGVSPIEVATKFVETQKKITRAMQVCGAVAKLYKRRGQPPKWLSIETSVNALNLPRRRVRLARQAVRPTLYVCGTCQLPFIGADRCQCKPAVKARQKVEAV